MIYKKVDEKLYLEKAPQHPMVSNQVQFIANQVLQSLPLETREFIKENAYIAGGCFRSIALNLPVNDYDVWFKTREASDTFQSMCNKYSKSYYNSPDKQIFGKSLAYFKETKTSHTFLFLFHTKIQFVTKFVGTPQELLETFDFKHAQSYYDLKTEECFLSKHLTLPIQFNIKARYPISALKRYIKLSANEKSKRDNELIKIVMAIKCLDLSDDKVLEEQLNGMYYDKTNMKIFKQIYQQAFNNKLEDILK